MPQTTGDYQSFQDNVLQMTKQTSADGTTFDSIHKQLLNNDTFLSAMLQGWMQKSVNSGVIDYVSGVGYTASSLTAGQVYIGSTSTAYANMFGVAFYKAMVNGSLLSINGPTTLNGVTNSYVSLIQLDPSPVSNVAPALPGSARDDLVFLEAWRDAASGAWKTRTRVVDGVDFASNTEGLGRYGAGTTQPVALAQGGNASPIAYSDTYASFWEPWRGRGNGDQGLYVAGDGSSTAKTTLNTYDGYSYAIPLFRVRRRNSQPFDPDTNPVGGDNYYTLNIGVQNNGITAGQQYVVGMSTGSINDVKVNDYISGGFPNAFKVVSVNTATAQVTLQALITVSGAQNFGSSYHNNSNRPDGLYSNIIDASDIMDLRHQVGAFDKKTLLELGTQKLQRGQLTTHANNRYSRDYIGLNTSSYTDDANTLLYLKFDGSINGTANGSAVAGTNNGTSVTYVNGVQGLAVTTTGTTQSYISYPISSPSSPITLEYLYKTSWASGDGKLHELVNLNDSSNTAVLSAYYDVSSTNIIFLIKDSTGTNHQITIPTSHKSGECHYLKLSYDGTTLAAQTDEIVKTLAVSSGSYAFNSIANAYVYTYYNGINTIDLVRVSNIARTSTPLPANFSYANGDRILDGPNGDFSFWSDDVGGTTGTGGRTNPYGVTHVPNQIAARVSYNGSEIRHYFGQGITAGWSSAPNQGTAPTGSFEQSSESELVTANETADGTKTTFTFNLPSNAQGILAVNSNNLTVTVKVNGSYVTPSSLSWNGTMNVLTAVVSTAPSSGQFVQAVFVTGQRHVHFVPSTKGFIIHDWTDETHTGDGTTTAFTTTKKNVTSVNHVRVNGVIQNGGYTVTNTNQTGSGATVTFTTAPANGATIDIVYESILTPALGDYIRIHYQHTPYQGLLGTAFAGSGTYRFMYVDEDGGFVTTLGTGSNSTPSVPAWAKDYPVMSAQLPISGYDYQLKHDVISLSNSTVSGASQQFLDNEQLYELNNSSAGNIYSPATTITPTTQTTRGYSVAGLNDGTSGRTLAIALRDLATSVPHVVGVPTIVQDTTSGELLLAVVTATRTDAKNGTDSGLAMDVFKLPGRPLIKGYGGVAA